MQLFKKKDLIGNHGYRSLITLQSLTLSFHSYSLPSGPVKIRPL